MEYNLYSMINITEDSTAKRLDGFIFFISGEDRYHAVYEKLDSFGTLPKNLLVLEIQHTICENRINYDSRYIYSEVKINLDPTVPLTSVLRRINSYIDGKRVVGIDISVMPVPIFAQILHFIFEKHPDKELIIYYTEPGHYNLEKLFNYSSFDGGIDLRTIPGFEGRTAIANVNERIAFYILGFEVDYINAIIPQEINNDEVMPINGFPSFYPKYKDISLINNNVNYKEMDREIIFSSANNPFELYNQINLYKEKYVHSCIDIILAGSKPMALGACLYALKKANQETRLLYPFPDYYTSNKSAGSGTIWEYVIELS